MPSLREISINLTANSAGFTTGINNSIAATKRLEASVKQLQATMGRTAQARASKSSADAEFAKTQQAAKRLEAEMAKLQQRFAKFVIPPSGFKNASSSIDSLTGKLKSLAVAYISVDTAIRASKFILTASADVERQERAWTGIAGSVAAGRQELEFVRGSADKLGVSFTSLEQGYRKLTASAKDTKLEGAATRQIFTDISQALQVLGASSDDVSGTMHTLSQMISTGVVQADELRNELGNRLPNVMGIAAKSMNMTVQEFRKLQEVGGVLTNDFLPNFARLIKQTYVPATESGQKATLALWQEIERAGNVITELAAKSFKDSAVEGFIKRLIKGFNDVGREALDTGRRLDELADRNSAQAISKQTQGRPLTESKESLALQADIKALERRILEAKQTQATLDTKGALGAIWARTNIHPQVQADMSRIKDLERQYFTLLNQVEKFRQGEGGLGDPNMGTESISGLTEQATKLADRMKTAIVERDAILKKVADLGVTEAAAGKTPEEVRLEQSKLLTKELEDFTAKYKDLIAITTKTPVSVPDKAASLSSITRPSPEIAALIKEKSAKYKLDPAVFESLIWSESKFNPKALGPVTKSGERAMGLGQLMPGTARELGVTNPYDPSQNLEGSAKYLAQMIAKFPTDLRLALAAYNAGPGNAQKGLSSFPETQKYVKDITERTASMGRQAVDKIAPQPINDILQPMVNLSNEFRSEKDSLKVQKELIKADEDRSESLERLLKSLDPVTTALDAQYRAQELLRASTLGAAGDTDAMGIALDNVDKNLKLSSNSLNTYERSLVAQTMESELALLIDQKAANVIRLKMQAHIEESQAVENHTDALKEQELVQKALVDLGKDLQKIDDDRIETIADIIAQMKEGMSTAKEYEAAMKKLRELGAGEATIAVGEGLAQQSSATYKAIDEGSANLSRSITDRTIAMLSGSKDAWDDFGQYVTSTLLRIVMEATGFEKQLTALLASAMKALTTMIASGAGTGATYGVGAGGDLRGYGGPQGRAKGGFLGAGESAMMGEQGRELYIAGGKMRLVGMRGPEVIRATSPGFVIPHRQTMSVINKMAHRAIGGALTAGQSAVVGEQGVEGMIMKASGRGGDSDRPINVSIIVPGVQDAQSFLQNQARLERSAALVMKRAVERL